MPKIRSSPEDFVVEEMVHDRPCGEGHHTWIWIEKRLRNTADVADDLARELDLDRRQVGYAGRKDKVAVTRQWFSVPEVDPEKVADLEIDGVRVLEAIRHRERLRVGALDGNCFTLVVRDVESAMVPDVEARFSRVIERGLPNRFGDQRFGTHGDNAERGAELLKQSRIRGNRRQAWFLLSALQSAMFNEVLARRPAAIDELLPGDLAIVHATDAYEWISAPEDRAEAVKRFEISPTGPIFGTKMRWPRGAVADLERQVLAAFDLDETRFQKLPRGTRLFGQRRPLRARITDGALTSEDGSLRLTFGLPAGSYATVLLEELFPDGFEEG